jgi:hypothetical protein
MVGPRRAETCAFLLVACAAWLEGATAAPKNTNVPYFRRRTTRGRDHKLARHRMDLYKRLITYVFAAVLLPILCTFVYSLCTDPAVPEIARRLLEAAHRRFAVRLSTKKGR